MKRLLPMLILCLLLGGCSATSQVENQAFALSLALQKTERGTLQLSIQIPAYHTPSGEEGAKSGQYLVLSAEGYGFSQTLDTLSAASPRKLKLSQLKSIIVSDEVARGADFPEILREMVLTYQLYSAASFVVCEGDALAFLKGQEPLIGSRLSSALPAELHHAQETGTSPRCTLADIFYAAESVYGDPTAILASQKTGFSAPGEAEQGTEATAGELPYSGDNANRYFGAALMKNGQLAGTLNGYETQLLNLVRGELPVFNLSGEGNSLEMALHRRSIRVDLTGDVPRIGVTLRFRVSVPDREPDTDAAASLLTRDLTALTRKCQALGTDPFDFALYAASDFPTVRDWIRYDWRARFPEAEIRYDVAVTRVQS